MSAPATTVFLSHDNTTFVEVTSSVAGNGLGLSFRRGRSRVLGEWLPGTCSIAFRNDLRVVDPTNDSATFQPRPGDAVRIKIAGTDAWRGWVDTIEIAYAQGNVYPSSTTVITGSDDLALLSRNVGGGTHGAELTSTRVSGLLTDISYPRATSVATGLTNMSGGYNSVYDDVVVEAASEYHPILSLLQIATAVEGGASQLFIAKSGTLTWRARSHRSVNVQAFGGTGIGFTGIDVSYTDDEWYNSAAITPMSFFLSDTSVSTVTAGNGTKTFTLVTGGIIEVGENVWIGSVVGTSEMTGTVTSYTSATKVLVCAITNSVSLVSHSDWVIRFTAGGITVPTASKMSSAVVQAATDTNSTTLYNGTRTYTGTLPFLSPTTAAARAVEVASGRGNPSRRTSSLTVDLGGLSGADQASVRILEIGDAASVYLDLGTGDPQILNQTRRIDGIAHSVPGTGSHRVTFTLGQEASVNFTTVLKQNAATVASTTNEAVYVNRDGWITAHINLAATAAGTSGTEIKVTPSSLPTAATNAGTVVGFFEYKVTSGATTYFGSVTWDGTDLRMRISGATAYFGVAGGTSVAVASGDTLSMTLTFRSS